MIRSIERAQELGEVFTPPALVSRMLDEIADAAADPSQKVLEPACGNGNFLVNILHRRLSTVARGIGTEEEIQFALMRCLTSIYGVEIDERNVIECQQRMLSCLVDSLQRCGFNHIEPITESALGVLRTNVVVGDALGAATTISFVEYTPVESTYFSRRVFFLEEPQRDLFFVEPPELDKRHFLELHKW